MPCCEEPGDAPRNEPRKAENETGITFSNMSKGVVGDIVILLGLAEPPPICLADRFNSGTTPTNDWGKR